MVPSSSIGGCDGCSGFILACFCCVLGGRGKNSPLLLLLDFFWTCHSSDCSVFNLNVFLATLSMFVWGFFQACNLPKKAFLLLSCSGAKQQHGEKSIPWIHLLIPLGTTWGTLTLTTRTGEGCRHRAIGGKPAAQNRREQRDHTLWCFQLLAAFAVYWQCKPLHCLHYVPAFWAWAQHRVDVVV